MEILFTTTMLIGVLFLVLKAQRSLTSTVSSCLGKEKPARKLTCKYLYIFYMLHSITFIYLFAHIKTQICPKLDILYTR